MRSMTSYGYSEFTCEDFTLSMELKSYNNRYLDVSYNAPPVFSGFEPELVALIKNNAQRGHIDISVKLKTLKGCNSVSVDEKNAKSCIAALKNLSNLAHCEGLKLRKASVCELAAMEGVLYGQKSEGPEKYRCALDYCCSEVMKQFNQSKDREGLATKKDLEEKIAGIEKSLGVVKSHVAELESIMKESLIAKIHEMLEDRNYDENRILTEVAVILVRYTINEETVRLAAHIAEFRRLLESDEPVGKKMDFLCQEMNREINTISSKSQIVEVNFEVVNMKDCLENIREQIRNIE